MLGRLWPRDDDEAQRARDAGYDLARVLDDRGSRRQRGLLLRGHGVTDGDLVRGVRFDATGATTQSLVMRGRSGTIRQRRRRTITGPSCARSWAIGTDECDDRARHGRRGRPAGAHRRRRPSGSGARSPSRTTCDAGCSRAPTPTCARAGSWRFTLPALAVGARTAPPRAATSAGRSSSSCRGACSPCSSSRPTGASCASSSAPDGDGTDLRVTQRGFEGNEEWLADFRGGWGSFNDRLAAAVRDRARSRRRAGWRRRARSRARSSRVSSPGRSRSSRARPAARPYWYAEAGRITLVLPGVEAADGYDPRREEPCDALCREPAARRRPGRRAREPRALAAPPRLDDGRPAARGRRPRPSRAGCELALPYRPALDSDDPEPFVRAFERSFCAPGRAARPRRTSHPAARFALAGGPHPRPLDTPLARLPSDAVARFWRLRLRATASLTADWEGDGWTAGRNRGTSTWTFARRRAHRTARAALRSGRAAHGRRMTRQPWIAGAALRRSASACTRSPPSSPPSRATPRT